MIRKPDTQDILNWVIGILCIVLITWYAWHGDKLAISLMGALLALCITSVVWFRQS